MSKIDTWQEVPKNQLGLKGMLYKPYWKMEIQCPDLNSLRKWNGIDINDPISVSKHIMEIVCDNTRITDTRTGEYVSSKHIFEHDKMPLLFLIFDKYNTENKMDYNVFSEGTCENPKCKKHFPKLIIRPSNFVYQVPEDKYLQFIDTEIGGFRLKTKDHGEITYKPSTIGVGERMAEWVASIEDQNWFQQNQDIIEILQSLCNDFSIVDNAYIRNLQISEYNLWSTAKKIYYITLLNKLPIRVSTQLQYACDECETPFRSYLPYTKLDKDMFIDVQGFDDQLFGEHGVANEEHIGYGNGN